MRSRLCLEVLVWAFQWAATDTDSIDQRPLMTCTSRTDGSGMLCFASWTNSNEHAVEQVKARIETQENRDFLHTTRSVSPNFVVDGREVGGWKVRVSIGIGMGQEERRGEDGIGCW